MALTVKDIGEIYGSLNEISANPGPSADRRATTTTEALSRALADIYTPDALADKTTFLGIVLISYPTKLPRQGSKQELLHTPTPIEGKDGEPGHRLYPYYDVYKVYIPELEPIPLNWDDPNPSDNQMTLQQRVMTFDDIIPSNEILRDLPGPIPAGTIVAVQYEDLSQLKNPRIVGVNGGGPAFDIDLQAGATGLKHAWQRGGIETSLSGFPWSDKKLQKTAIWKSTKAKYAAWNGTILRNGEIQDVPGLLKEHRKNDKVHCQLLAPAYEDWQLLTSAYKNKFGEELHGSGYRTWAGQVAVRMERVKGDQACAGHGKCRDLDGTGSGVCDKNCNNIGYAAVPGTSNHGWAAAVDIYPGWAFPCRSAPGGRDQAGCDKAGGVALMGSAAFEKWKWLNKFGKKFNFVFNVDGEHWHLGWIAISEVAPAIVVNQNAWDPTGIDEELEFGPGPDAALLARAGETPEEAEANRAAENEAARKAKEAEAKAAEKAAADKENEEFQAEFRAMQEEKRLDAKALCQESAFLNEDGTSPDDLAYQINDCRTVRYARCKDFTPHQGGPTGPTIDGRIIDCTEFGRST